MLAAGLQSRHFRPNLIWQERSAVDLEEICLLLADGSILDKHRSKKIECIHYQYSGNAHDVIPEMGLVNLLWDGLDSENSVPVDYRVYDKPVDGKTKNTHFCEMLKLAKLRGICPEVVVMDSWYSSLNNLKTILSLGSIWVTGLRKNRVVNRGDRLEDLDIPDEGLKVHLRGYGWIWVFRFVAKNGRTDCISTNFDTPTREHVESYVKSRWSIEVYHRELKQTCGIERCPSRTTRAQRNHICMAIFAWLKKHQKRVQEKSTLYQQDWEVIKEAIGLRMQDILAYS